MSGIGEIDGEMVFVVPYVSDEDDYVVGDPTGLMAYHNLLMDGKVYLVRGFGGAVSQAFEEEWEASAVLTWGKDSIRWGEGGRVIWVDTVDFTVQEGE